jgi:hypothetical protein
MINFMKNNREVIGILSIVVLIGTLTNSANASDKNNLLINSVSDAGLATKVALSVSRDKLISKYEKAVSLTDEELKEVLEIVGFKGKDLKEAWAIAKKESNGRPRAFNGDKSTGDSSYGIFQINMIGSLGPERREKFDLKSNAELFNPIRNAEIAFHMSGGGKDWSSWKGITPRTVEWMKEFPTT